MPKQTPDFSDEQLTAITGEGRPSEDRPGVIVWQTKYEPEAPPAMQIDLVPIEGTTSKPFIQYVEVTEPSAQDVTVTVYSTKDTSISPVYSKKESIPDSGTSRIYLSPEDNKPIEGSVVRIVFGEPKNPEDTTYDTTIVLVGCFEPLAGK
jgi:hypothetical protein